jgi:hypothetical protein
VEVHDVPALIQYSADGGATRSTIARDVFGTELTVNTDELPGSSQAVIFVTVGDGLNSAAAAGGPFLVASKPPVVEILKPADGGQVISALPVSLEGTGFDRQEVLKDSQFQWSSDLGGDLGTGRIRTAMNLKVGTHTVTLTVTSSSGLKGQDAIRLEVLASPPARPVFHRGDPNDDGVLDVSDGISLLGFPPARRRRPTRDR